MLNQAERRFVCCFRPEESYCSCSLLVTEVVLHFVKKFGDQTSFREPIEEVGWLLFFWSISFFVWNSLVSSVHGLSGLLPLSFFKIQMIYQALFIYYASCWVVLGRPVVCRPRLVPSGVRGSLALGAHRSQFLGSYCSLLRSFGTGLTSARVYCLVRKIGL